MYRVHGVTYVKERSISYGLVSVTINLINEIFVVILKSK